MLVGLSACSGTQTKTSSTAHYDQISSINWAEMTAASTAAHVSNNNLIMMR